MRSESHLQITGRLQQQADERPLPSGLRRMLSARVPLSQIASHDAYWHLSFDMAIGTTNTAHYPTLAVRPQKSLGFLGAQSSGVPTASNVLSS
jgi:hypothetical protein